MDLERRREKVRGYFAIPAAGGLYFVSAWFVMLFGGVVADELGISTYSYGTGLILTIALWLAVAPLAAATAGRKRS